MDTDPLPSAHTLARRAVRRVPAARGRRIECLQGRLWLTIDHDRRDIVLGAGQGFTLDRPDDMLLGALEPSRFLVLDGVAP